jgi:hypothetical protein
MTPGEHVVFFPGADGSPAFRRMSSLQEAVDFVEHLRNEKGVTEVSVFALTAVPLAFRTVYRVEVTGSVPAPAAPVEAVAAQQVFVPAPAAEPVAEAAEPGAEPVPAGVSAAPAEAVVEGDVVPAEPEGRSLGFFAG